MKREKKGFKLNFFDIIIILVIVCVAVGVYLFANKSEKVETKKLTYTLELTDNPIGFSEKIAEGDELTDNVKNYKMGKVTNIETIACKKLAENYMDNSTTEAEVPGRETVILTVEADVTETASEYKVDGSFVVRAGKEIFVKGPGYAGIGYILTVNR